VRTVNCRDRANRKQPVLQAGFSLLEMVVALVILSLSLAVLYQAAAGATRNVRSTEHYAYAILIAESLLAEHPVVGPGGVSGGGEVDDFHWVLRSEALGDAEGDSAQIQLHRLMVEVAWPDGVDQRRVGLQTVVPQTLADE